MNHFVGIGRWTNDIEVKPTSNSILAKSTLAINEKRGDNEQTQFLPVVMFGKLAENVAEYSGKGRLVCVEGRVNVRKYEQDGQKRTFTEIVANSVKFLDRRREREPGEDDIEREMADNIDFPDDDFMNVPF